MIQGGRVTHGCELHCRLTYKSNNLEINWKGNSFHMESLTSVSCSDDPSIGSKWSSAGFDTLTGNGVGRLNGVSGATVEFTFTDAGEPGTRDMASIVIKDRKGKVVLSVSGYLKNGNHQAHKDLCYGLCSWTNNWQTSVPSEQDNCKDNCIYNCTNTCTHRDVNGSKNNGKNNTTCKD